MSHLLNHLLRHGPTKLHRMALQLLCGTGGLERFASPAPASQDDKLYPARHTPKCNISKSFH